MGTIPLRDKFRALRGRGTHRCQFPTRVCRGAQRPRCAVLAALWVRVLPVARIRSRPPNPKVEHRPHSELHNPVCQMNA